MGSDPSVKLWNSSNNINETILIFIFDRRDLLILDVAWVNASCPETILRVSHRWHGVCSAVYLLSNDIVVSR